MTEPTEADREKAANVLDACGVRHEFVPTFVAGVAAALAEEREKARDEVYRELIEGLNKDWHITNDGPVRRDQP